MQKTTPDMTADQAFSRLSALCARAEHCSHEMTEKMRRWGLDDEAQAQVMQRLTGGRFVDDSRFAHAFVGDKVRYGKWGRRKIEQALRMKHIDQDVAAQALDSVTDREYLSVLRPMLTQKRRTTKADDDRQLTQKLIKFALGRGYTIDIIRQCLTVEDEDWLAD